MRIADYMVGRHSVEPLCTRKLVKVFPLGRPVWATRGFTLIEMLLVIGIIAVMVGIAAPVLQSVQVRQDTITASTNFVQTLRRAYIKAKVGDGRSAWGVKIATSTLVIFKGNSYAGRDTNFDENVEISSAITVTGTTEFVFGMFTGLPTAVGTTTFVSRQNDQKTVFVNGVGIVSY